MQLTPEPRELLLEVYDKETLKNDDFVGSGSFILTSIGKLKVPIFEQYKSAG